MKYSTNDVTLSRLVAAHKTLGGILSELKWPRVPFSYAKLALRISELGLDASHLQYSSKKSDTEVFSALSNHHRAKVKKRLLEQDILEYKCYGKDCNVFSIWNGKPISLQLDHINGIPYDNRVENLRLLCPNCHSQTPTFGGRNKAKTIAPIKICPGCKKPIKHTSITCRKCQNPTPKTKIKWPPVNELLSMLQTKSYLQLSRELGVSDNAIRKRIRKHGGLGGT
jgi:hypothetical protein